ncbi:valine--tRNA ligase [Candidatus Woesearchaeota archaeon CG10_big_fil_rev_8_21_14_0_10_37_12]|nr:MAG: valine--tRNA ligase [Candidatus Woesearchaeota archaeon CG10_big_fil_rev_8_21_14_0_10_37_12]
MTEKYNPHEAEIKWMNYWEKQNTYKFDPKSNKPVYAIDTPPPTVSGKMHVGHSFSYSRTDFIARFHRMIGKNVFYPFGTDDNGLATERLVEKLKGVNSKKMKREEFVKLVLETLKEITPEFISDWKRIGVCADYSIYYSTIDNHCQKLSQLSFIDLYKKGRAYRAEKPIIFCPNCKTVIAQVEMEDKELQSTLNYIKAKLEDGRYIIFATTRPELMPGNIGYSIDEKGKYVDVKKENETWIIAADAYEKFKDEWQLEQPSKPYLGKELIGKKVTTPIINKTFTITHDQSVKTNYGTGIVYFCSYGGLDCVEWLTRHKEAEPIHIMGLDGVYNEKCGEYQGMNTQEARSAILEDLEQLRVLIKKEKINHTVNVHERCGIEIEYISTAQWFIKILDLKDDLLKRGNELNWHPEHMKNRYDNWTKGLHWDWCISRQRHYGIPIPVWYHKKTGEVLIADEQSIPIDPTTHKPPKHLTENPDDYIGEKDVLDTWATSSLTPQIAIELINDEHMKKKLFPMDVRPQAHDIITFWLFNTVIKSHLHYNKLPWKDTIISGWVLDPKGRKMSKSKGNIIDPREQIQKYSADALRYAAANSKLGQDNPYKEQELTAGIKLTTKLSNASKFVFMNLEGYDFTGKTIDVLDKWILTKLAKTIHETTIAFENYDYSKARALADEFFWHDFCDYYLELVKGRIYEGNAEHKSSAQETLYHCMYAILRLYAPIIPFITEELYHKHFKTQEQTDSIHLTSWPTQPEIHEDAEKIGDTIVTILADIRKRKTAAQKGMNAPIKKLTIESKLDLSLALDDLKAATCAETIEIGKAQEEINEGLKISVEF